jgi:hypothetical protein
VAHIVVPPFFIPPAPTTIEELTLLMNDAANELESLDLGLIDDDGSVQAFALDLTF